MSRYSSAARLMGATVLVVGALAACGDSRVKDLTAGISRDSTFAIMGTTPTADDSIPNVHQRGVYLINGRMYEVLLFPSDGDAHKGESLDDADMTPVVMADGALAGWGWSYWDSVATANKIPRRPMSR